jgi:hypothetical protein
MWLSMVLISVCVCLCVRAGAFVQIENMLTLLVEKCQCSPPLFHVDEMVYHSVIQYTFIFFVVLGYLAKRLTR